MSNSPRLPREGQPFYAWLARYADAAPVTTTGPRWRTKLLKGKSLTELMAERPHNRPITLSVDVDELPILSHHVLQSGLSRHAWLRRAVAHYLVHVCGVDRTTIPSLTRDLP